MRIQIEVERFAERMQYKLDKNKHKECKTMNPDGMGRHWNDCSYSYLLSRIEQELEELRHELNGNDLEAIANECADVANFAMMIADNATTLK